MTDAERLAEIKRRLQADPAAYTGMPDDFDWVVARLEAALRVVKAARVMQARVACTDFGAALADFDAGGRRQRRSERNSPAAVTIRACPPQGLAVAGFSRLTGGRPTR